MRARPGQASRIFSAHFALAFTAAAAACAGRADDAAVSEQGSEVSGVPVGEFHRAGQPCTVCHTEGSRAAKVPFSVAGTIFAGPSGTVGVDGAEVELTDSVASRFTATTNCVGNFFVTPANWSPVFPIRVRVAKGNVVRTMAEPVQREGSCAACHVRVRLFEADDPAGASKDCPVNPDVGP
jgi:hypothetical protein